MEVLQFPPKGEETCRQDFSALPAPFTFEEEFG
jgi:hypothetical protein